MYANKLWYGCIRILSKLLKNNEVHDGALLIYLLEGRNWRREGGGQLLPPSPDFGRLAAARCITTCPPVLCIHLHPCIELW